MILLSNLSFFLWEKYITIRIYIENLIKLMKIGKIGKIWLVRKRKIENKNINSTKIWKLVF